MPIELLHEAIAEASKRRDTIRELKAMVRTLALVIEFPVKPSQHLPEGVAKSTSRPHPEIVRRQLLLQSLDLFLVASQPSKQKVQSSD